jgi:hypothetical protein
MKTESLKELEEEVRRELGIKNVGPNMSTHEAGMIGGYMVKKMIERAEKMERGEEEEM